MKRWLAAAATVGVLVASPFAVAATVLAHAEFASSNPAAGTTLTELPDTVELTFSEVVGFPAALAVTDPDGNDLDVGDLAVVDRTMTQSIDTSTTAAGSYRIAYQVTSADGHPISGTIDFTVTPSSVPSDATTDDDVGSPTAAVRRDDGPNTATVVILLAALAGGLGVAGFGLRRAVADLTSTPQP